KKIKEGLNGDNPILTIYPYNIGFSPNEIMKKIVLPVEKEKVKKHPDEYLKPTNLIWRTMNLPGCYHVAIYLGDTRVAHIGSSKFVKASKIKDNKKLLGARIDYWQDFLRDTNKLIRYHLIIPFKRPEKIKEHITKAILAECGSKDYSFLGNNCEHFATFCVCGIPFSTQSDKVKLFFNKVYLDLVKETNESNWKFDKMNNSEMFEEEIEKIRSGRSKEIKKLKSQTKITIEEERKITKLKAELRNLEEFKLKTLQSKIQISPK
ncbi:6844_t:CDS:1, partial [Funneliformis geosporum]